MSLDSLGAGEQWLLLAVLIACASGVAAGLAHFIAARRRYRARWITRLDGINAQRSHYYGGGLRHHRRHW